MELRCQYKKHGEVIDLDVVEVKCDSRFCGAGKGVTVLHRFNIKTGDLVETLRFKDPRKEKESGSHKHPLAVRSA